MTALTVELQRLEALWAKTGDLARYLQPPLSQEQAQTVDTRDGELRLPQDVVELLLWHNGMSLAGRMDFRHGPHLRPLPVEDMRFWYDEERSFSEEELASGQADDQTWHPGWLPLWKVDGRRSFVVMDVGPQGLPGVVFHYGEAERSPGSDIPLLALVSLWNRLLGRDAYGRSSRNGVCQVEGVEGMGAPEMYYVQ